MKDKKINRRDFVKAAALVMSGTFFGGCNELYRDASSSVNELKNSLTEDLSVQYIRQIITADSSNSRCIMWHGDGLVEPVLEIKIKNSDDIKTLKSLNVSFTDDDNDNNQYSVQVKDLNVNESYEYRIVDGEHCSKWHDLKTMDGKKFKALIFPDSQCADYGVWSDVATKAYERNTDAEFFVNMGDIVDNGEDWTQWRAWFNGADRFIDKIPFVPIMGNHECYNRQWKERIPLSYLNYFEVPENDSQTFQRYYYSFDYGDVHFAVLNSQWDEINQFIKGLKTEQQDWLRRDIQSSNKKWKIILIHKDVLQYRINGRPERQEGFSEIGTEFMPLFDELKIDLVLTAHLHTYRDRGHIYNFEHNPQGPLYILTGVAGDVRYSNLWIDHALDKVIAPQPETDNYLTLEVSENQIDVKCFLPDGTEIDHATIKK